CEPGPQAHGRRGSRGHPVRRTPPLPRSVHRRNGYRADGRDSIRAVASRPPQRDVRRTSAQAERRSPEARTRGVMIARGTMTEAVGAAEVTRPAPLHETNPFAAVTV